MKNIIKTLTVAAIVTTVLTGPAQAYFWDYYNNISQDGKNFNTSLKEPSSFDASAHTGTYFWGKFDQVNINQEKPARQFNIFDDYAHQGTYFWGEFNK